ncbi:MAG: methionyl-tRNA formyltransferase [Desulfuromonadaceae bacterium]|nr:methionyl-tRNA formyltransferase [Desulfuromonadaceae bacterium]
MEPGDVRTVFMGTPEFAVPALRTLVELGMPVAAVFTQPDRPKGRGQVLMPPPVKALAEELAIPVIQPARLRQPEAVAELERIAPDLIVVAAYGQILPKNVLEIPRFGCINVHASLLPRYRGASPINKAILEGETETGITTMLMDAGLDTGAMLVRRAIPIGFEETAGELHDRLARLGGEALAETIRLLCRGELRPEPQNDAESSYAPLLKKEDGLIDWHETARRIHNQVRGLDPWPGAYSHLRGTPVKLYRTLPVAEDRDGQPGMIAAVSEEGLTVFCGSGALLVREVQLPGRKRLPVAEFLRGHPLTVGELLES